MEIKILILCAVSVLVVRSNNFIDSENKKEQIKLFKHLNKVLLCLDSHDQLTIRTKGLGNYVDLQWKLIDDYPELNIEYHLLSSCQFTIDNERDPKRIFAVIAPKPLPLSSNIPMYFFDTTLQNDEDVDVFPNALFPLRDNWQFLKLVFSHYITTHEWKRVAIVSDDSYYSQAFEAELVQHFRDKKIVYHVQPYLKTTEGFHQALKYIEGKKAFIIIVNIENTNAQKLLNAARGYMLSKRFVWLVRDWPFENMKTRKFYNMISLTLSPHPPPFCKAKCDQYGPYLNSVSRGLALINDSMAVFKLKENQVKDKKLNHNDLKNIEYYYRATYQQMNEMNKCHLSKAFIRKFQSGEMVDMKSLVIHARSYNVDFPYPKDDAISEVKDLEEFCLERSSSFENPCDDTYLVYICVTWLMFIVMMIVVVYFFNRCLVWT